MKRILTIVCLLVFTAMGNAQTGFVSDEMVQDYVGTMLSGTETGVSVTYDDAGNAINFVVTSADSTWTIVIVDSLLKPDANQGAGLGTAGTEFDSLHVQDIAVSNDIPGFAKDAEVAAKADSGAVGYLAQAETITGNWVNTDNPWADNEIASAATWNGKVDTTDFTTANYFTWYVGLMNFEKGATWSVAAASALPDVANGSMYANVPIPFGMFGMTVVIDQITVYYNAGDNADDDFDFALIASDQDGTITVLEDQDDIGAAETGVQSATLLAADITLTDNSMFVEINQNNCEAASDVVIYDIKFQGHLE